MIGTSSISEVAGTVVDVPTLDVVIVNYNTRERTLECIGSVLAQRIPGLRVVLVDNGSLDGSAEAIRTRYPEAVVVDAGENTGFARAVNRGVAVGEGEYVLLLNPDASVHPGSLEALRDFAIAHPEYGVYGGRTVRQDGSLDPSSCWGSPSLWSLLCFASTASTVFKRSRIFDPESLGSWQRDTVKEVDIVTGCLLLTRRETWTALGGMDERFFLYGEDAEFSARARRAGHRPVVVPAAVIQHDVGGSTDSSGRKMSMVMAGKATLLRTSWPRPAAAVGVALLQAGSAVRAVLERATRASQKTWRDVWATRADWRRGYPHAERTLFGRVPPALVAPRPQRRLVVQAEPAFRTAHANPYTAELARALQRRGVDVTDLSYAAVARGKVDVVHLHWPDLTFLSGSRRIIHAARLLLFYSALAIGRRLRGTILVWTVHNVSSHEQRSSERIRSRADRLLLANLDGILSLTEGGLEAAREAYPPLRWVPSAVTPHGHYRGAYDFVSDRRAARAALGLRPDGPVILSVGQVRPYKNIPHLIEAFSDLHSDAQLVIAGAAPAHLAAELTRRAHGHDGIVLRLAFLSDDELSLYLAAADLVVLPYRRVQNSGSAILALSADRPVLVPELGAMRELADAVGSDWVRLFADELSVHDLRSALSWATLTERAQTAPLSDFEWDAIAATTESAFRRWRKR